MTPTRRGLMGSALGLAGVLAVPAKARLAESTRQLALFDPASDAGSAFAGAARKLGAEARALRGDRVRLARTLLADRGAVGTIAGLARYADFLLIAGCGEETGWRIAASGTHGAGHLCEGALAPARDVLVASGGDWPQALAEVLLRADRGGGPPLRRAAPAAEALTSWLMVRREALSGRYAGPGA
jgi:hypothetical protein